MRFRNGPRSTRCRPPPGAVVPCASQPGYGCSAHAPGAHAFRTQSAPPPAIQLTMLQLGSAQHAAWHEARLSVGPCATNAHSLASPAPTSVKLGGPACAATATPPAATSSEPLSVTAASSFSARSNEVPPGPSSIDRKSHAPHAGAPLAAVTQERESRPFEIVTPDSAPSLQLERVTGVVGAQTSQSGLLHAAPAGRSSSSSAHTAATASRIRGAMIDNTIRECISGFVKSETATRAEAGLSKYNSTV